MLRFRTIRLDKKLSHFFRSLPCLVREALRGVTLFSGVPNRRVKESEWEDLRGPDEFLTLGGVHITLKISLDGLRTLEAKETVMQA